MIITHNPTSSIHEIQVIMIRESRTKKITEKLFNVNFISFEIKTKDNIYYSLIDQHLG